MKSLDEIPMLNVRWCLGKFRQEFWGTGSAGAGVASGKKIGAAGQPIWPLLPKVSALGGDMISNSNPPSPTEQIPLCMKSQDFELLPRSLGLSC